MHLCYHTRYHRGAGKLLGDLVERQLEKLQYREESRTHTMQCHEFGWTIS
jgi:hypothetical protein